MKGHGESLKKGQGWGGGSVSEVLLHRCEDPSSDPQDSCEEADPSMGGL